MSTTLLLPVKWSWTYQQRLIVLCCLVTVLVSTVFSGFVTSLLVQRTVSINDDRLRTASDIGYSLIIQDRDRNLTNAQLLAARTTLQEALTNDTTTNLQDEFLEPNRVLMQLDFVSVVGIDNRVVGQAQRLQPPRPGDIPLIRTSLSGGRTAVGIVDVPSQTWLIASAPIIRENRPAGAVVVGRVIDDGYMASLSRRLGSYQAGLVKGGSLVAISTGFQTSLNAAHISRPGGPIVADRGSLTQTWQLGHERYDIMLHALGGGSQSTFALGVLHEEGTVLPPDIRLPIVVAALAAIACAIALSALAVRFATRPLRGLHAYLAHSVSEPSAQSSPVALPPSVGALGASARQVVERNHVLEENVAGHRSRMEALLESMPVGIVLGEHGGHVSFTNAAAREMLGLIGGRTDPAEALSGRINGIAEGVQTLDAGNGRVLAALSASVKADDELLPTHLTVLQDVTRERQLDHLRTDFLSTVSHELRTPLTSIKSSIDLLLDGDAGELSTLQRRFLLTVQRNAERLIDLVTEILDLSRIESGQVQLHLNPVDVRRVLDDVSSSLSNLFDSKRQEVDLVFPPEPLLIQADRRRFEQVMTNLLANAGLYSPEGGHIRVSAEANNEEPFVEIVVRDDGPGIPPDEQMHIFEKFYRGGHSLTRQDGGTGLGLAIVKSLVDMHHGRVSVKSELGQGTTFTVALPRLDRKSE